MYSLILMSAMATTPTAPEFNGFFRDLFSFQGMSRGSCNGCNGSSASSRPGGCHGSRMAASPRGGSCTGSRLDFISGSCQGSRPEPQYVSSGCCGGGVAFYSCFGSGAAASGFPARIDSQDLPGGFAVPEPIAPIDARFYSPVRTVPYFVPGYSSFYYPTVPTVTIEPITRSSSHFGNPTTNRSTSTERAQIIVRLPMDAELFVENQRFTQTGPERKFTTPPLQANAEYEYTFRISYLRNGETITRSKSTIVKPGDSKTIYFDETLATQGIPSPAINHLSIGTKTSTNQTANPTTAPLVPAPQNPAQTMNKPSANTNATLPPERAKITVKLPPGTTLYIDDKKHEGSELIREFTTPPVPHGQEFAYIMKAERLRNGLPEMQTMKVPFRAGESQQVDFTYWPTR